jgi:hypothetical protein
LALSARQAGKPSAHLFKQAIDNYLKANQHSPQKVGSLINAASTLRKMSEDFEVLAKKEHLLKAKALLTKVTAKAPLHFVANYYLSLVNVKLMNLTLHHGLSEIMTFEAAHQQLNITKSINNNHPYVLDVALKLQRCELESSFSDAHRWQPDFDDLITLRRQLAEQFGHNAIIVRNYIGSLTALTAYRLQLNLPSELYVTQLKQALTHYADFKDVNAYAALSELFEHWETDEIVALNLTEKYHLKDQKSDSYTWALAMVTIASATHESHINDAIKVINNNKGLLPIYKQLIVEWANNKAKQLSSHSISRSHFKDKVAVQ